MSATIQVYQADGTTATAHESFDTVRPGESKSISLVVKNTGDADATNVNVGFQQVGDVDMENWVTAQVGSVGVASYGSPVNVGTLAAGATLNVTITDATPSGATVSDNVLLTALYVDRDS